MRPGQPALTIFAHGIKHVAQSMDTLPSIFAQQGQVRNDELPFFIAHVARINFAAHATVYPIPSS